MKKSKLTLAELKVKSFTILTDSTDKQTIAGGAKDTTPDDTPHTVPDKPIDLPETGIFCPTGGINWCPPK